MISFNTETLRNVFSVLDVPVLPGQYEWALHTSGNIFDIADLIRATTDVDNDAHIGARDERSEEMNRTNQRRICKEGVPKLSPRDGVITSRESHLNLRILLVHNLQVVDIIFNNLEREFKQRKERPAAVAIGMPRRLQASLPAHP